MKLKARYRLGIEITGDLLKVVELDLSDTIPAVKNFAVVDLPSSSIDDVAGALSETLKAYGFRAKTASILVDAPGTDQLLVAVPEMSRGDLSYVVDREVRKNVPDPESKASSFSVQGRFEEKGIKKMEVLIVVAPADTVRSHMEILQRCSLDPGVITVPQLALREAARITRQFDKVENVALLNLSDDKCRMSIFSSGVPQFSREFSLPFARRRKEALSEEVPPEGVIPMDINYDLERSGAEETFEGVTIPQEEEAVDLSPPEEVPPSPEGGGAEIGMEEESVPETSPETEASPEVEPPAAEEIEEAPPEEVPISAVEEEDERPYLTPDSIEVLVTEVNRSLLYFRQQKRGRTVDLVLLSGEVSGIDEIAETLKAGLKIETEVNDPLSVLNTAPLGPREEEFRKFSGSFVLTLGLAAIAPRDNIITLVPKEYLIGKKVKKLKMVLSAALVAFIVVVMLTYFQLSSKKKDLEAALSALTVQEAKIDPKLSRMKEIKKERMLFELRMAALERFRYHNSFWIGFFKSLSLIVPDGLLFDELLVKQIDSHWVMVIEGRAKGKSAAEAQRIYTEFYKKFESLPFLNDAKSEFSIKPKKELKVTKAGTSGATAERVEEEFSYLNFKITGRLRQTNIEEM